MNWKTIPLSILLLFSAALCNAQSMSEEEHLKDVYKILNADYGTCYTIDNYMLCPETKIIRRGGMFGTATKDCFGFFPDSTLKYDQVTLIVFGDQVFFDNSDFDIDWSDVKLLSFRDNYAQFTDGKILYNLNNGQVYTNRGESYNADTCKIERENRLPYRKEGALTEVFLTYSNKLFGYNYPVLEQFDVPKLHTITSKSGYETNFITDGKRVLFGGSTGGCSTITKNGREYIVVEELILEGVDLPTLRVLGRDLIADKNALYYRENVIPLDKLNGLKVILREIE